MIARVRKRYPPTWESLAANCKERANWQCEHCGAEQFSIAISKKGTPYFIYLHAAHKNHDKENPTPELLCLCVSCHARYDYKERERQKRIVLEQIKHLHLLIERGIVTVTIEPAASFFE
jgi:hypothetical protein